MEVERGASVDRISELGGKITTLIDGLTHIVAVGNAWIYAHFK